MSNQTFNQWTKAHDDSCAYVNEQRVLRKKMKYYTSEFWAEHPSMSSTSTHSPQKNALHPNKKSQQNNYIDYTPIGNKKAFFHKSPLVYPEIGEPTSLGNKKFLQFTRPQLTTPNLGSNKADTSSIDVESKHLQRVIGRPTNLVNNNRHDTTGQDWNRWHYVDKNVVQNPKHVIFTDGIIPVGGMSSRNQLRNFSESKKH